MPCKLMIGRKLYGEKGFTPIFKPRLRSRQLQRDISYWEKQPLNALIMECVPSLSNLPKCKIFVFSLWALVTDSLSIFLANTVCGGLQSTSQKFKRNPRMDTLVPEASRKCARSIKTTTWLYGSIVHANFKRSYRHFATLQTAVGARKTTSCFGGTPKKISDTECNFLFNLYSFLPHRHKDCWVLQLKEKIYFALYPVNYNSVPSNGSFLMAKVAVLNQAETYLSSTAVGSKLVGGVGGWISAVHLIAQIPYTFIK